MSDQNDRQSKISRRRESGVRIALGAGFGVALGAAIGNIALGLSIGIVIGGISIAMDRLRKK